MGLLERANYYLEHAQKATPEAVMANQLFAEKLNTIDTSKRSARTTADEIIASVETGDFIKAKRRTANLPDMGVASRVHAPQPTTVLTAPTTVQPARQTTVRPAPVTPVTKKRPHKLRKLATGLLMGLALHTAAPISLGRGDIAKANHHHSFDPKAFEHDAVARAEIQQYLEDFKNDLKSSVSEQERDIMAKMLYGEAGRGVDPFEILHTVLNRKSSPLFKGSITDIVTQKGQYVGYRADNPVTPDYRRMVDIVVAEWEDNGCQKIEGCDHFYFITGIPGVCNKFEISEDHQGRWVAKDNKKYAQMRHYCNKATDQAARYFAVQQQEMDRSV